MAAWKARGSGEGSGAQSASAASSRDRAGADIGRKHRRGVQGGREAEGDGRAATVSVGVGDVLVGS